MLFLALEPFWLKRSGATKLHFVLGRFIVQSHAAPNEVNEKRWKGDDKGSHAEPYQAKFHRKGKCKSRRKNSTRIRSKRIMSIGGQILYTTSKLEEVA